MAPLPNTAQPAVIGRQDAINAGLSRYFTGKPCKRGHIADRQVVNKCCSECLREYAAVLRQRPDQIAKAKDASRRTYLRHREKILQKSKDRNLTGYGKRYYEANKAAVLVTVKAWIKANPDRRLVYRQNRRAAGRILPTDVQRIAAAQRFRCAACRTDLHKSGQHIDHIVPIALGGTSNPSNIQLLCPTCNRSKGAKDPIAFMQSRGRLL